MADDEHDSDELDRFIAETQSRVERLIRVATEQSDAIALSRIRTLLQWTHDTAENICLCDVGSEW